jgi:hypothetical protein
MAGSTTRQNILKRNEKRLFDVLEYLMSVWGILSFGLIFVPALMLALYTPVNNILQPIASVKVGGPIALLCTFVIAFYVLTLRDVLFRYTYTLPFGEKPKRPIPVLVLLLFVIVILLAFVLGFGLAVKDSLVTVDGGAGTLRFDSFEHMILKLFMTGCLIFILVLLSLSASLMAAYRYGKTIPTDGDDAPLYTREQALTEKVLAAVCQELGLEQDPAVSDMTRSSDGGIALTLKYRGEEIEQQNIRFREEKTIVARADHRGQLIKIEEKEVRQSKVEAFQVGPVLEAAREVLGIAANAPLAVSSMKRDRDGEVSVTLAHQGKTWLAKADRWSRLISIKEKP